MTQEDKELLLKDLCARARYKVKICVSKGTRINIDGKIKEQDLVDTVYGVIFYNDEPRIVTPQNFSFLDKNGINHFGGWTVDAVKPYLRPMNSMTEEEVQEIRDRLNNISIGRTITKENFEKCCDFLWFTKMSSFECVSEKMMDVVIDYLDENMFDHRGLIEKGLAIKDQKMLYICN